MKEMVKRQFLFALATAALFGACTNESEPLTPVVEEESGEQVITLKVSSLGDGASTRAGRELLSEAPGQNIDIVKIIVVDGEGNVVSAGKLSNWQGSDSELYGRGTSGDQGRQGQFIISGDDKISENGTYTIYAFGYNSESVYNLTDLDGIQKGGTFAGNPILTKGTGAVEEIFAGSGSIEIKDNKNGSGSVELRRQVSGTFGYFENIPYENGKSRYLALRATGYSTINDQLVLGGFVGSENISANVINGLGGTVASGDAAGAVIYEIDLNEWFTEIKKAEDSNLIAVADNWMKSADYSSNEVSFKEGSVFGSTFLIPFENVAGKKTFVLELQDVEHKVLRTWNIKLPSDDEQVSSNLSVTKWIENAFTTGDSDESVSTYSILRNHLYSVGTKKKNVGTESSDDVPQDLSKTEEIVLNVVDNWQVIHHMVVD